MVTHAAKNAFYITVMPTIRATKSHIAMPACKIVAQIIAFVNPFFHISKENIPNSYIVLQQKKLSPVGVVAVIIKGVVEKERFLTLHAKGSAATRQVMV